ncbi:MAG: phosphotransferase [Pseudomonadota bacterium]
MHDELRDSIEHLITEKFPDISILLIDLVFIRNNSLLFRIELNTNPPKILAVKCCISLSTNQPDSIFAQEQYLALKQVEQALGKCIYQVPEPLFLDKRHGILVMNWINGETLTEKLLKFQTGLRAQSLVYSAGSWVGMFHRVGPLEDGIFDLEHKIETIKELQAQPLADELFREAGELLHQSAIMLHNHRIKSSWIHGDCKADNFIIHKTIVYGLDFNLRYQNAIEYDIAQFLNNLELLSLNPKNFHLRWQRKELCKNFVQGYHQAKIPISPQCIAWIRLYLLFSLWHTTLSTSKSTLKTWVLKKLFQTLISELIYECRGLFVKESLSKIRIIR